MNKNDNNLYNYSLNQIDSIDVNHTYKEELHLLEYVKNGAVEQVEELCKTAFPSYPNLVNYSQKKSEEYMAVGTIALVARAVIPTGVSSHESFELSDFFLKRIASASTVNEIIQLRNDALIEYTKLVHTRKFDTKANMYVEDCILYITSHIFQKIRISDIASSINVNPVYLERIFKKVNGISISDYIILEKIERAKNLLIYSDRTITEISDYLGFSSQSHFGKTFKKCLGVTPKQFRIQHHLSDF